MGWTLRALLDEAGCAAELRGDGLVSGLAYDHRAVEVADLFCCIPGARADGHDHASAAVAAGASGLLVERFVPLDVPQARVERVRSALGPVADVVYGRPSRALQVAGVTGTNGKTTVTYLVEAMASAAGHTAGVIGSVERRLGDRHWPSALNTPESVDLHRLLAEMRDAGGEVVAMEVTSEGMDMGRVDGTRFACAAFTNLSQDHLNYHGTMDAYFDAKARLFSTDRTTKGIVNAADPWGRKLLDRISGLEVVTFGAGDADVVCTQADMRRDATRATLSTPWGRIEVRFGLVGNYNLENLMCAAGIALVLGLGPEAVAEGAGRLGVVPGRLEHVDAGQPFTVLVDYAHTPDALERALRAARELTAGRLISVFGCGGDRDRAKRPLMGEAAARISDLAIVTSDNPRSEDPLAIIDEILVGVARTDGTHRVIPDRRDAIAEALAEARPGDVVVVAGKGHESGQQFADRTIPFDDRQVVRELLGSGEVTCRR